MAQKTVERVCHSRVLVAPKLATVREIEELLKQVFSDMFYKDRTRREQYNRLELFYPALSGQFNGAPITTRNEDAQSSTSKVVE